MAATAMDYENANPERYEDEGPRYERDRSASPRAGDMRDDSHEPMRRRSPSPVGNRDRAKDDDKGDDNSINPGSNLFVTGIHPSLKEDEIIRLFEKYGEVEKCQIMRDPHSQESRGFGFVKMVTSDQANAARDALQGEVIEGRTLSIEKARRACPRTPTPGKYFGPPKRGDDRRFGERRRGPYGGDFRGGSRAFGGGGRDDSYRGSGYRDEPRGGASGYRDDQRSFRDEPRYESRGYRDEPRYRDDRDRRDNDYPRGGDRFERDRYRDDRYGGERDRRGGYNDRDGGRPRDAGSNGAGAYSDNRDSRDTYGRAPSSVKPSGNDNN